MSSIFRAQKSCEEVLNLVRSNDLNFIEELRNGTTIITGANSGIGKVLAEQIALLGGCVVLAVRYDYNGASAKDDIEAACKEKLGLKGDVGLPRILYRTCDLSSFKSVLGFCQFIKEKYGIAPEDDNEHDGRMMQTYGLATLPPLRLLVCNAGIKPSGRKRRITWEGFEQTFQVNYLAHFFMITQLKSLMSFSSGSHTNAEIKKSRVIFVSDKAGYTGPFSIDTMKDCEKVLRALAKPQFVERYVPEKTYASSKLCALMAAKFINDHPLALKESENDSPIKIAACSVNPGYISNTNLRKEEQSSFCGRIAKRFNYITLQDSPVDTGAASVLFCCLTAQSELNGDFFDNTDFKFKSLPTIGERESAQLELFKLSKRLCSLIMKYEQRKDNKFFSARPSRRRRNNNNSDNRRGFNFFRRKHTQEQEEDSNNNLSNDHQSADSSF